MKFNVCCVVNVKMEESLVVGNSHTINEKWKKGEGILI